MRRRADRHGQGPVLPSSSSARTEAGRAPRRRCRRSRRSIHLRLRTHGAGGSPTEKVQTIDIVSHPKRDFGLEAMAHFTCVVATVAELRETLDLMRDRGVENVPMRAATRRRARRVDRDRGRPALLTRAGRADPREYDFDRRRLFPRVHIHATDAESDSLHEGEGRRRRGLPDHAAVLRQLPLLRARRARPRIGIDVPIIPGIMPITNAGQIRKITSMCGSTSPPSCRPARAARRRSCRCDRLRRRLRDPAVRRSARQRRPRDHFYTLNRSPATRAILALRTLSPGRVSRADVQRVSDARTPVDLQATST
jgi:methylenetetrahydrofolate reductase (NADPH)